MPAGRYDPTTGAPLTDMVEVGTEGTVTSWSWVAGAHAEQALESPHALAFIRPRGSRHPMLHVIDAPAPTRFAPGIGSASAGPTSRRG